MNMSMLQIFAAFLMLGIVFFLVLEARHYLAAGSERRMREMLVRVGLDPSLASRGKQGIMKEIRQRCSQCNAEGVCERWLAGEQGGTNDFCPNAEVFAEMKKIGLRLR